MRTHLKPLKTSSVYVVIMVLSVNSLVMVYGVRLALLGEG